MSTFEFRFADIGEGLEDGEIVEWLIGAGSVVTRDQPLVSVETDKAVVELPSPVAGTVVELRFQAGDRVRVGEVLVVLDAAAGSPLPPLAIQQPSSVAEPTPSQNSVTSLVTATTVATTNQRAKAAPAVRRLAVELGVELAGVAGTGPGGRVVAADVHRAVAARTNPPETSQPAEPARRAVSTESNLPATPPPLGWAPLGTQPLRGIRRRTAEVMARAWAEIPHITVTDDVDATRVLAARDTLRAELGAEHPRLTLVSFALAAAAQALRRHPIINASLDAAATTMTVHREINIGVAVATPDGLVVPVVGNVDHKSIGQLARELADLAARARSRRLSPAELSGGTFTITNYGSSGGTYAAPIIRPPEVAILGLGALRERPWAERGLIVARPVLPVVLAADHRLLDGDVCGSFLTSITAVLSDPIKLLLGSEEPWS